jgi:4a-hydroxytetrahydrobiopterin dehydratase
MATEPEVLRAADVDAQLVARGLHWARQDEVLARSVRRADFAQALAAVNAIGALAEAADHHPDIDIRWNTVTLRLSTHSAGGITEKDLALAAQIDAEVD